jgi:hypothetical protein
MQRERIFPIRATGRCVRSWPDVGATVTLKETCALSASRHLLDGTTPRAPRLLIIDGIGYLPIDRHGANLFVQLISRRDERAPKIATGNQSFGAWGKALGDRVIATAILDELLHRTALRGRSPALWWQGRNRTTDRRIFSLLALKCGVVV